MRTRQVRFGAREADRQPAGRIDAAEQDVGDRFAAAISGIPGREDRARPAAPTASAPSRRSGARRRSADSRRATLRIRSSCPAGSDRFGRSLSFGPRLPREHDRDVGRGGEPRRSLDVFAGGELDLRGWRQRRDRIQRRRAMPKRAHELDQLRRSAGRRVVDRDAADRIDAGRAAAGEHADVGAAADHRDAFSAASARSGSSPSRFCSRTIPLSATRCATAARPPRRPARGPRRDRARRPQQGCAGCDAPCRRCAPRRPRRPRPPPSARPRNSAPRRTPGRGPRSRPVPCCGSRPSRT